MSLDQKLSRSKQRLILLLAGVVGLAVCASLVFFNQNSKKETASVIAPQAASAPADRSTLRMEGITDITVEDVPAVAEVQAPVPAPKKSTKRMSSRKQIAMRFPPPPVGSHHKRNQDGGEVEMWAADKRTVIFVPPGSKFEE